MSLDHYTFVIKHLVHRTRLWAKHFRHKMPNDKTSSNLWWTVAILKCLVFPISSFSSKKRVKCANNSDYNIAPETNVIILKIFSSKNKAKKIGDFCQHLIMTLVFEKNANIFAENWQKIAENCDHNIGLWSYIHRYCWRGHLMPSMGLSVGFLAV
jgi:hypothetical protein